MRIAILFAGQGSQYFGMGRDFYESYPYVRSMYAEASRNLGYDIGRICFEENDLLHLTEYTQPAITVTNCALYEVLRRELKLQPAVAFGFSLGEYSALYAAGVFNFSQLLQLIKYRAEFMTEAAKQVPGGMAAIIGLTREDLERICLETGVYIANYNCPNQLVIAGQSGSLENAVEKAKSAGAKRAVMLNVSGAFHTPLMSSAAQKMREVLRTVDANAPEFPVIMNYDAKQLRSKDLKEAMEMQIKSPVRFEESIRLIRNDFQIDCFIEIGPGKVLSGLVRRIDSGVKTFNLEKIDDLQIIIGEVNNEPKR